MFVLTEVRIETEPSFQATRISSGVARPGIQEFWMPVFTDHDTKTLSRKIKVKATTVAAG
jgi:hypothetical protein